MGQPIPKKYHNSLAHNWHYIRLPESNWKHYFPFSFIIPLSKKLYLRDTNLLSDTNTFKKDIFIKVRSTGKLLKAKANFKKNFGEIEILQDERGVSPGQACVFYSKDEIGERVLGGGWIDKTVKIIYPHNSQSIKKPTNK